MAAKRFTNAMIEGALRACDGVIPRAAERLGTSRSTVHDRINRSTKLQEVIRDIDDEMREYARGNIHKALKDGDLDFTKWFADRRMRDEGYGAHVATSHDNAAVIEKIATAIASAGIEACRAVQAALAGEEYRSGPVTGLPAP